MFKFSKLCENRKIMQKMKDCHPWCYIMFDKRTHLPVRILLYEINVMFVVSGEEGGIELLTVSVPLVFSAKVPVSLGFSVQKSMFLWSFQKEKSLFLWDFHYKGPCFFSHNLLNLYII